MLSGTFTLQERDSGYHFEILSNDYNFPTTAPSGTELRFSTGSAAVTAIDSLIDPNTPFLILIANDDPTNPVNCVTQVGSYSSCDTTDDLVYIKTSMLASGVEEI